MNRDDIIRMAREAGNDWGSTEEADKEYLFRFAALVAAAEREACAKVCETQENRVVERHPARIEFDPNSMMARKCAAVIRARGTNV